MHHSWLPRKCMHLPLQTHRQLVRMVGASVGLKKIQSQGLCILKSQVRPGALFSWAFFDQSQKKPIPTSSCAIETWPMRCRRSHGKPEKAEQWASGRAGRIPRTNRMVVSNRLFQLLAVWPWAGSFVPLCLGLNRGDDTVCTSVSSIKWINYYHVFLYYIRATVLSSCCFLVVSTLTVVPGLTWPSKF